MSKCITLETLLNKASTSITISDAKRVTMLEAYIVRVMQNVNCTKRMLVVLMVQMYKTNIFVKEMFTFGIHVKLTANNCI